MTLFDTTPTYNLKVIIQETDIKPDTLRAWERRYGLPKPDRTKGGHRLYSQHDIEMVKWFLARQDEGLSISRAVKLWRSIEEEGNDPLLAMPNQSMPESRTAVAPPSGSNIAETRNAWIQACLDFNEKLAEQVITQAFAVYPPEMVCVEILQRGLAEIGMQWYENKTSVQQEHFASALAMRRLNTLLAAAPPPTRPGRIIIGCPPEELHTFAPMLLTLLLRYQGWEVIYLGANIPSERLKSTIKKTNPQILILTAQQLYTAANLYSIMRDLQEVDVHLAYGGRIFNMHPALNEYVPGHFLGNTLSEAAQMVNNILTKNLPAPRVKPIPDHFDKALSDFQRHQGDIESMVWHSAQKQNIPYDQAATANTNLARDMMAAIRLGDTSILGPEISWVESLMTHYHVPVDVLQQYLQSYHRAAAQHLDDDHPLVVWLADAFAETAVAS